MLARAHTYLRRELHLILTDLIEQHLLIPCLIWWAAREQLVYYAADRPAVERRPVTAGACGV